jgi:hypothetical protein
MRAGHASAAKAPAVAQPTETLNGAIVLNLAPAGQNAFRILPAF